MEVIKRRTETKKVIHPEEVLFGFGYIRMVIRQDNDIINGATLSCEITYLTFSQLKELADAICLFLNEVKKEDSCK